jgi:hypothetical protein
VNSRQTFCCQHTTPPSRRQEKTVHGHVVYAVQEVPKTASKAAKNDSFCPGNERCEVDHHSIPTFCPTHVRTSKLRRMDHSARIELAVADLESQSRVNYAATAKKWDVERTALAKRHKGQTGVKRGPNSKYTLGVAAWSWDRVRTWLLAPHPVACRQPGPHFSLHPWYLR